ncbi:HAD family hydrolase [Roseateles amylovorans]|uniref:HAD-IB family hydrolase n=1 Tax=Roseateles amylovorans TaxID=2978473 RepID=A0ABY6B7I6_9BURK|nr:HAD family hydrolase [Roseateles amylovorans]UXH80430.1 HAD-IB family hydrolase [Roseateles amylovorans]
MDLTLFDLDGTLIPQDSDHAFGAYMVEIGWADGAAWAARNDEFYAQYQRGELNLDEYVDFATSVWRARPLEEALAARQVFMERMVAPMLRDNARALVRRHLDAGDLVVVVTATNEFVTEPIAKAFGVDHLIAVRLERDDAGRYTGRVDGVPSFQAGKIVRVRDWLRDRGQRLEDFERVNFYSDSMNDLPLLELVSHPIATNPSVALETLACERGWPILKLFE